MGSSQSKLHLNNDNVACSTSFSHSDEINHNILIDGYLRNIADNTLYQIIPNIIHHLITMFYPNYTVYGIGSNQNGHLDDDLLHIKQYKKLNTLSQILTNIDGVYSGWKRLIIKDIYNSMYGAGINSGGQLGFFIGDQHNESIEQIRSFTKIPISDELNKKNTQYFVELIVRRTFLVCNDETNNTQNIYVCGANFKGECVSRNIYNESTWRVIDNFIGFNDKIIQIKGGYYHSLFLTENGNVWCCGDNDKGQCGRSIASNNNNNNIVILDPQLIIFDDKYGVNIDKIYCGTYYNFCIDNSCKTVWVFGSNKRGQLGIDPNEINDDEIIDKPYKHNVLSGMDIVTIQCGFGFSGCLNAKGICYFFGTNDCGQISNGQSGDQNGVYHPYMFQSNDNFKNVVIEQLECGGFHTVLLTQNTNNVITFGSNLSNQCSSLRGKEYICSGHIVSKKEDIGINENEYIEKIVAQSRSTLIIINKHKSLRYN